MWQFWLTLWQGTALSTSSLPAKKTNPPHLSVAGMYAGKSLATIGNFKNESTCGISLCRRKEILCLVASPFPINGFCIFILVWVFTTIFVRFVWFCSYDNKYHLWMMRFRWVSAIFVALVVRTDVFRFNCTSWCWFSWSFTEERVFLVFLDDVCSFQQRFKLQVMFVEHIGIHFLVCF